MADLIYTAIASLDGYVADEDGSFDWSVPSDEVHAFVNDLERSVGTHLYGRRMYEVMSAWEDDALLEGQSPVMRDYAAIWRSAVKIVYSSTLQAPTTARTRIEHAFDPDEVRKIKESSSRDLAIGGPTIAGQALAAGLVDEVRLFVSPVIVGGGTRALPPDLRQVLELLEERRFENGVVYLRYRVAA